MNITSILNFCFRLVRYLHPTDKELRHLLGLKKKDSQHGKRSLNGHNDNVDIFQIPKNLDIEVSNFCLVYEVSLLCVNI